MILTLDLNTVSQLIGNINKNYNLNSTVRKEFKKTFCFFCSESCGFELGESFRYFERIRSETRTDSMVSQYIYIMTIVFDSLGWVGLRNRRSFSIADYANKSVNFPIFGSKSGDTMHSASYRRFWTPVTTFQGWIFDWFCCTIQSVLNIKLVFMVFCEFQHVKLTLKL